VWCDSKTPPARLDRRRVKAAARASSENETASRAAKKKVGLDGRAVMFSFSESKNTDFPETANSTSGHGAITLQDRWH
jgi:hypothetical protein